MSEESFRRLYEKTRFIFWFIGVCIIFGALLGNDLVFIAGILMLVLMAFAYISVKFSR